MDLDFTREQKMIRDEAINFLKKECPFSRVKEIEESKEGYSEPLWRKMADLGWLGFHLPEAYGGDGGLFLDLVILQEVMGSALLPSPFFSTAVQCALILLEGGTERQKKSLLPGIAAGELKFTLAQYEADGSYLVSDVRMKAERLDAHYLLNGTKMFVMDANISDRLFVAARTGDDEVTLFDVSAGDPGIRITKMPTIGMDNCCEVVFENVKVPEDDIIGKKGDGEQTLDRMVAKASIAKAAEMIGSMRACLDMTNAYAKERVQYGKPIGGFQAIQHDLANMLMACDLSQNYLYRIACKVDQGEDFQIDGSALKAMVNKNYKFISERGVQIHGGIGTAREGDVGLFYRKAKSNEYLCGDTDFHHEMVFEKLMGN